MTFDFTLAPEPTSLVNSIGAPPQQEHRYFKRMATSLGHKVLMLQGLVLGSAVDIGAGGGELAVALRQWGARPVYALDFAPDALRRLDLVHGVVPIAGRADQLPQALRTQTIDNIVCSAVLHEVFSYGSSTGRMGYEALHETLQAFGSVLNRRGRLIIRDGVMPEGHERPAVLRFTPEFRDEGLEALAYYRELSPFGFAYDVRGDEVHGTLHAVTEFAFTYTWGVETFEREARERYMVHTLGGYADAVRSATDLRLIHAESVVQEGYRTNIDPKLRITVDGKPRFPATNAIWTFERR